MIRIDDQTTIDENGLVLTIKHPALYNTITMDLGFVDGIVDARAKMLAEPPVRSMGVIEAETSPLKGDRQ